MLDGDLSYMQNKHTGRKTRINYDSGKYIMHVWAPAREREAQDESAKILKGNKFAILATEGEEVFSRRA